jgi:hypothetical protein
MSWAPQHCDFQRRAVAPVSTQDCLQFGAYVPCKSWRGRVVIYLFECSNEIQFGCTRIPGLAQSPPGST